MDYRAAMHNKSKIVPSNAQLRESAMQFKSLMAVIVLGVTGLVAHAKGSPVELTTSATFSSAQDKGFFEQARFFLPRVLSADEAKGRNSSNPATATKKQDEIAQATPASETAAPERFAMLMAALGVVGYLASRRKNG
jgi:K+-transporting ATPase c subunit